ncbi:MAG: radical SAM protein, partial [Lachnospiraceae bacterium]|nr:radical SAM protein [Lachnospiraceae bacterium]
LKGVCITGGEPTLHADLPEFIFKVKKTGYKVKLDTNGYAPDVLKMLIDEKAVDYVAMDIKNCPDKYASTVGMDCAEGEGAFDIDRIKRSVSLLKSSSVLYEFRTTVVKEFHTREDLLEIGDWIKGCPCYYMQQYQDNENILCRIAGSSGRDSGRIFHGYTKEEMEQMAAALRQVPGMTGEVSLRGV